MAGARSALSSGATSRDLLRTRIVALLLALTIGTAAGVFQTAPAGATFLGGDGTIVFAAVSQDSGGSNLDIYSMKANGSAKTNLTSSPAAEQAPAWSPDGRRIVFTKAYDVYVMSRAGDDQRLVFPDDPSPQITPYMPSWSPDGTHIVFLVYRRTSTGFPSSSIEKIRLADGERTTVVEAADGVMHFEPSWSPDGSSIVFSRYIWMPGLPVGYYGGPADADVMTADVKTRAVKTLAGGTKWEHRPSWTPDGDVLFVSSDACDAGRCSDIVRISPDGVTRENLTNDPGDWSGQGGSDYFDRVKVSPNGNRLLLGISRSDEPIQLWTWHPTSDLKTKLLHSVAYHFDWQPRCSMRGTPDDDVLMGTPGRDLMCGLGGDDIIKGRGGDDVIFGHGGNDRVVGGRGRDIVVGNGGRDRCEVDRKDHSRVC